MAVIDDTRPSYASPPATPAAEPPTTLDLLRASDPDTAPAALAALSPEQQASLGTELQALPAAEREALFDALAPSTEAADLPRLQALFGREGQEVRVDRPVAESRRADTPQEAFDAIAALPPPDHAGMSPLVARMPGSEQQAFLAPYNARFNEQRATLAQDALDRLAPQREDFTAPGPGHVGELEYDDALRSFNADPYVRELSRIVAEVQADPTTMPPYLTSGGAGAGGTQEEMLGILANMGIDLGPDPTTADIADGFALVETMPADMVAAFATPGMSVRFDAQAGLASPTTRFSPTTGVQVEARAQLSEVQVGADFGQTQQFRMSVSAGTYEGLEYKRTLLDKLVKGAGYARQADRLDQLVERSPLLRDAVEHGRKAFPVSGSYTVSEGQRLEYETVMTPEQGARVDAGDLSAAPDPLDPLAMAEGTSVLVRAQQFEGTSLEVNFKAFTLGSDSTTLSGSGFGVRRGEGSMVEVYSGPIDTVETSLFLGIGRQGALALGVGSEERRETQDMAIARIDLGTAEGRAAYQQFMSTGQVPAWTPPGVPQSGSMRVHTSEDTLALTAELGSFGGSLVSEQNGASVETRWQDGSGELVSSFGSPGGTYTQTSTPIDTDGNYIDAGTRWRYVLNDVSRGEASFYHDAFASTGVPDGNQHLQLTYDNAELMALRDQARLYLDHRNVGANYAEVRDGESRSRDVLESIALAETPGEVFGILSSSVTGTHGFYGFGVELRGMSGLLHHLGLVDSPAAPGTLEFVQAG